jgi:acyl-CoA oxidase
MSNTVDRTSVNESNDGVADVAAVTERVDTGPIEAVQRLLLGSWPEERLASRDLAARPEMQKIEGLPYPEHRERALEQLRILVNDGQVHRAFPTHLGGEDDHGGNIAGFEELVVGDPSHQIKSGVQWGLFGAAVLHLGTQKHHDAWLPAIMSLEVPGIFAMTETGHGSDVASIGTTATYDETTEEFVIDTPFRGAWKDYLGNAAVHGTAAVVFAQLITKNVNHGVHALYVPIRGEDGGFLDGIGGEDDGLKGGLNGIDNGRLHFTGVRVPRENLLNRYGDVAADGTYSSSRCSERSCRAASPSTERPPPRRRSRSRSRSSTGRSGVSSRQPRTPTRRCCSTISGTSAGSSRVWPRRMPTRSRTTSCS